MPQTPAQLPRSSMSSILRDYMDPAIASGTPPRIIGAAANVVKKRMPSFGQVKREEDEVESGMEADLSRDAYDDPPMSPKAQKRKRSNGIRSMLAQEEDEGHDSENVQTARGLVWFLIAVLTISWSVWFATESRTVGFCDMGSDSNALLSQRALEQQRAQRAIDEGDDKANISLRVPMALRPTCLPCPPHAICQGGALVGCESSDFILQHSILAQLPLVKTIAPLSMTAPSCSPDQQKVLLAADLADEIESRLRIWKGHVQCRRASARIATSGKGVSGKAFYGLPKEELYLDLKEEVGRGSVLEAHTPEYFEELWGLAMEELEATSRVEESGSMLVAKRGGAGIGLRCSATLLLESAWERMRFWLAAVVFVLSTGQWLRYRWQSTRLRKGEAKKLVAATLSRLEQAKRHSVQNGKANPDGFLSISQLRDDILRHESLESRKRKLWASVAKIVEANTNVRTRQAKVRGEWSRVWEWIGALKTKEEVHGNGGDGKAVNMGKGRMPSVNV